jgi:hypothetical protein
VRRVLLSSLATVAAEWRARSRAPKPHTTALSCRWNCPVTVRTTQGMAPYLARLAAWPLVSGQSASGGSMSKVAEGHFRKETRSALDIEEKHVTIQGPSPDMSPATTLAPSACATWLSSLLIRRFQCGSPAVFRSVRDLGRVHVGCPGGSGSSEGCSSVWLPARAAPRLLSAVFKSVRNSCPAALLPGLSAAVPTMSPKIIPCISRAISTALYHAAVRGWCSRVAAHVAAW